MKHKQSGFTLIEIAIVLVIIGLLLGGVLKGQELINSAKVKNIATDFRNIPVFVYGYQDKFRGLPGDDKDLITHLLTATVPTSGTQGNGSIEGIWNATGLTESHLFWQHVRMAGLAAGPTDPGAAGLTDIHPVNASGGTIGISATTPITGLSGAYYVCSDSILGKYAKQLDITMDDGVTNKGSMMAALSSAVNAAPGTPVLPAAIPIDDSASYVVCMGF